MRALPDTWSPPGLSVPGTSTAWIISQWSTKNDRFALAGNPPQPPQPVLLFQSSGEGRPSVGSIRAVPGSARLHQRKREFVKRSGESSDDSGNLVLSWGSCYGWRWRGLAGAGGRARGLAEGMLGCRAGTMAVPRAVAGARHPGLLALRSASGLGLPAWWRAGLPRQRSTELVRSSGRPGESCPGCGTGLVPDAGTGSLSPSSGGRSKGTGAGCGQEALVRRPPPGSWRHRRRWRDPSWCRGRPWSRSSAAGRRRTRRGPWRAARGPRRPPR